MDHTNSQILLQKASILDKRGQYLKSDAIFLRLANYYQLDNVTNPGVSMAEYDEMEDEFQDAEQIRRTKKPNLMPKQYYDLGGEADGQNIEGKLNGPDSVPGPAYIDPGNTASSPSMAGNLDQFSFEETYQKNEDEGNGWKNRIPNR
jgi:hypothetical protein